MAASSSPRLVLLQLIQSCKPKSQTPIRYGVFQKPSQSRTIHATRGLRQDTFAQRYGTATEPPMPPSSASSSPPPREETPVPPSSNRADTADKHAAPQQSKDGPKEDTPHNTEEPGAQENLPGEQIATNATQQSKTPLDIVLKIPPPSDKQDEGHKPPHLAPSPYVHHFDTYSLVKDLNKGSFTEQQAITIMKAVRSMLAINLDVAKEGLVSKSDTENETYLFRAACSELRTSLQTSRQSEVQKQRTNRGQLQHEADILNQRVTQDMLTLREELKGMFNDRKMASQEEKRKLDGKIQQLNYEITVLLNSDSKSEVEGLRWVLTRRAALAIVAAAFMILGSLQISSHVNREREEAEKKLAASKSSAEKTQVESKEQGTQTDEGNVEESLG